LFGLVDIDKEFFPSAPDGIEVHLGFQETFQRTAKEILAGVKKALVDKKVNKVAVTGHSLGESWKR
jgi:hypothetical protein